MATSLKTKKKNRSASDNSELNQTKKTLQEQEEKFLTILESSQDAIFAKDMQGRYTFINSAGMKFLNRKINEIIGKRDNELFDEESAKQIMSVDHKVLLNKCSMSLETCFGQGDDTHWYYATISPIFTSDGDLKGTIGVSRDMTNHRRLENSLRESEGKLLTILECSNDAIFAKDTEGRYTYINSTGAALLDLSL